MKRLIYLAIFLLPFSLSAQNTEKNIVFSNDELKIIQQEKNMWIVETADMSTMYIIEGKKKSLLIDTGTDCKGLNKIVEKITQKPLSVVVTHCHPDHAGNIKYFDDIYMHPYDTVLIDMFPATKEYKGEIHFINEGYIFDLGGTKLEVKHTPGHTPGSIVLLDWDSKNCYSGDAFGSGQVWLQVKPVSPISTYLASTKKMEKYMDKGIERIYCGHYPYTEIAYNIDYIVNMQHLAEEMLNGNALKNAKPFPQPVSIGIDNPKIVVGQNVMIVYDPENIK